MTTDLHRRGLLWAGLALSAGSAHAAQDTAAADAALNAALADPAGRTRIRAKLFGSTKPATIHRISQGHVWAETPDEPAPRPLFSVVNYAVAEWRPDAEGGFSVTSWDSAIYTRFGTAEPLELFDNPFTGAQQRPIPFLLGPMTSTVSAARMSTGGEAVARPRDLPVLVQGGQITWPIASSRRMPNPLDRARFPRSWVGGTLAFELFAAFTARTADLLDPNLDQAPAASRYDEAIPFPYWMEMAERPGRLIAHGFGMKLRSLQDAAPRLRAALERGVPLMFSRERWGDAPRNDLTEFLAAQG